LVLNRHKGGEEPKKKRAKSVENEKWSWDMEQRKVKGNGTINGKKWIQRENKPMRRKESRWDPGWAKTWFKEKRNRMGGGEEGEV